MTRTSLSFELLETADGVESHLDGKDLYIWECALPEPQLNLQELSSSSLIKNQLSLIQVDSCAAKPNLKIGVLADLYSTWLSLDDCLIDRKKVVIYPTRTSLVKDIENGKINALVDYPMAFWRLANEPQNYSIKPVDGPSYLSSLKPEVAQACWQLEEELLRIPSETLLRIKKQHISLLAEKDKPYLMVGLEKNYAPFSFLERGRPQGLFVDYADSYFRILGVPYALMFWQDNPSQNFDVRWGLRCENEKKGLFPFYKTPLILFALRDLANVNTPRIGYEVTKEQLSEYKKIYPKAEWLYESNLQASVDAWVWEGARLPKNLIEKENKTLLSQTTLYQKMLYFYLGANEELEAYFRCEGQKLLEKTSLLDWQEIEKTWIENPLYRSMPKLASTPNLSEEEKIWVFQHPYLRVGIDAKGGLLESLGKSSPISLTDTFLKKLCEPLGLKIEKVPILNSSHLNSLWEKGQIDAYISYSKKTYQVTRETYSFSLWKIPLFLYKKPGKKMPDNLLASLQNSSLGVWSKLAEEKALDNTFSEILYFPSPLETFQSLMAAKLRYREDLNKKLLEAEKRASQANASKSQILSNLIRNSLKFTESGLVKLTVSSHKRQAKKVWIEFKVEDTGIGIPEERLKDLFEPFSQVHDDLSVKKGGVGLGLYICQSLVELMGGSPLEVSSKVGVGSIFSFKIPFQLTHLIADHIEDYSLEEFTNSQALILERDPKQIVSFCEILLKMGLSYKIASSPSEVLSFLQREIFDIFFVEEEFLEKEGSSLFLIPYHNYPKDKIIILSSKAKDDQQLKRNLKTQGYFDYISYPYEKQEILSKLREFFKNTSAHPSLSPNYERHAFKNTRILLVEDHSVNQKVLSFMLENLGIQVDLASQGEEALFKFKKNAPYDLIFMDIQLPDKNGFTVAQEMRDWEKNYKQTYTPIISITANAMHGYKKLCLEKGLDDYLSKPIFFESLLSMLKNWISEEKKISFKEEQHIQGLPEISFLPNIPYLNLPQTLSNLDLELEDYLPMLAQAYQTCYKQLFLPLSSYAHGSRILSKEEMHKHIHTLAGVLGNLGALELFNDLKEVERWIDKKESQERTSIFEKLTYKLDEFFSAISKIASSPEEKTRRKKKNESH
ncbi:UNVERIFIED_CONTAM: hypothetical protein PYX00_011197 [Menopon gallinae]|uniref:Histidine kinase n=1 Tax=Menopon gallinae TaxID=328185 RepID=A0AAW2H6E7_9NEOP